MDAFKYSDDANCPKYDLANCDINLIHRFILISDNVSPYETVIDIFTVAVGNVHTYDRASLGIKEETQALVPKLAKPTPQ